MFGQTSTQHVFSSLSHSMWAGPMLGLLFACGGAGSEGGMENGTAFEEQVTDSEDALRAARIAGEWFLDADASSAQVRFIDCTTIDGCDTTGWRSAQAVFDTLCTRSNGRICIALPDISREATIVATREYTAQLILHTDAGDRSVPGVTIPNHPRAVFGRAGAIWSASSYEPVLGALGNASILDLTFSSHDAGSGFLQMAFGAALLVGDQAGAGVVTIRVPVAASRLLNTGS